MAVWAYPSIDPVALRIGTLSVHWYGLAYVAGFIFGWWMLARLNRSWKLGLTPDGISEVMLAVIAGVVLGGRLGYVLFYGAGAYWREPLKMLALWDGGMSFHGGLAGAIVLGWLSARHLRVPPLRLADVGALAAPVGLLLGRLANFVNGELWGRASTAPWAMVFPGAGPAPRHPSQLYEAALEGAVLFAIMLLLARRRRGDGELLGWMLALYAVFRVFVEFFREPDAQVGLLAGGATMGQLLSVPVLVAGVWLILRARRGGDPTP